MAEFNKEQARTKQREILVRAEAIYRTMQKEVVDYYWDSSTDSEGKVAENKRGIYKYLKLAYDDLNRLLNDIDR